MARQAQTSRNTLETRIAISVNLDGDGKAEFKTGVPFFEDMLEHYGTVTGVRMARKHLGWYSKGLPGGAPAPSSPDRG